MKTLKITVATLVLMTLAACSARPQVGENEIEEVVVPAAALTPTEAKAIAKEAFIFGFPIVMNYKTLYQYTLDKNSSQYKGDFNTTLCDARVFTPDDTTIVTPNSDTPYCMGWIDLSSGPLVVTVPEMEKDRFYHVQLIDWYTFNFAYIGTRTNQNQAGKYLLAGPGWKGEKPTDVKEVLQSETNLVFTIIRTQLMNDKDLARVKEIQGQYIFSPLDVAQSSTLALDAAPAWKEKVEFAPEMLNYLDYALDFVTPNRADQDTWDKLAKLGIGTPEKFELSNLDPAIAAAVAAGVLEGVGESQAFIQATSAKDLISSAKVFGTREYLAKEDAFDGASSELKRTGAAIAGLYGNSGEEAVYPTYFVDGNGQALNANTASYTYTFAANSLPPAEAFWSLSMYDGKTQLFVHNPLKRYLLKSSDLESFKKNEDGSITLMIQKDSPGKGKEANWLPAPDGPFYIILRVYQPKEEMLDGTWTPPAVIPVPAK